MNAKLLRIFTLLFFSVGFSYASASLSTTTPECYEKIEAFLTLKFGENFQQDENLVRVNIADTKLTMIIDKTPSINPSRYFFYTEKNNGNACLALTAPIANDVDFSKSLINGAPINITTRSAGQGSNDVTIQYKWIASKRLYTPVFCARGIGTRKNFFSCKSIYSTFGQ